MSKILIVDDDAVIGVLLSDYLTACGFEVQIENSAVSALENIKEGSVPNLLIADFQMPDMSGADLLKEIRLLKPELPVVLMSGNSDTQSIVEGQNLKADGYIQKPFSPKEVLELVQNIVK